MSWDTVSSVLIMLCVLAGGYLWGRSNGFTAGLRKRAEIELDAQEMFGINEEKR